MKLLLLSTLFAGATASKSLVVNFVSNPEILFMQLTRIILAGCQMKTLDFSEFPVGETVAYGGFKDKGYDLDIEVVGNGNCSPHARPTIFNTSSPTCNDGDLGMADMGNALIIQEDTWLSSCVPNDCTEGGLIHFNFYKPAILQKLVIADQDTVANMWLEKHTGQVINIPPIPAGPNGSVYTHYFNEQAKNVKALYLVLSGSGGIPLLTYQECNAGAFGDPHFRTFSGHKFDYHGQCDLVLTSAPGFDHGEGLHVHIRTTQTDFYSSITAAAVKIGNDILEVDFDNVYINGKTTKFTDLKAGQPLQFSKYNMSYDDTPLVVQDVTRKRKLLTVFLGNEQAIEFTIFGAFIRVNTVNPQKESFGDASGITGHFHSGLMMSRDQVRIIADPDLYGQEWQVNNQDPQLFHQARAPQWPEKCIQAPPMEADDKSRHLRRRGLTEQQAKDACAAVLAQDEIDDCVFDVLSTGDLTMVGAHM